MYVKIHKENKLTYQVPIHVAFNNIKFPLIVNQ